MKILSYALTIILHPYNLVDLTKIFLNYIWKKKAKAKNKKFAFQMTYVMLSGDYNKYDFRQQ